ncbi:conserved hypothetical protein [Desulfamplus magnetovallimortis]|uniref:Impact N-terminal domain-containing protein n=1 Tax=Desulfamplus magnetovallimortis TaxID=1246637 RepID=A0A1W1H6P1_9BACT|nr:YigZ family protein [Desulfamplus magnetovallimortis]SLM28127.1 conserved hypothetical protein [Desulfamplus magnetovallimortis]
MNCFYSIKDERRVEIKIRRSTFICSMKYVENVDEAKAFISSVSSEHKNANHNCWAYIVGDKAEMFHSSDQGEPAGTAGKPMLNALQSYSMTSIAAVVTRYFGGVKLGVRGLIEAYGEAVKNAIGMEKLRKLVKTKEYTINLPYAFHDSFIHQLKNFPGEVTDTRYFDIVSLDFAAEDHAASELEKMLDSCQSAGKLTFIQREMEDK